MFSSEAFCERLPSTYQYERVDREKAPLTLRLEGRDAVSGALQRASRSLFTRIETNSCQCKQPDSCRADEPGKWYAYIGHISITCTPLFTHTFDQTHAHAHSHAHARTQTHTRTQAASPATSLRAGEGKRRFDRARMTKEFEIGFKDQKAGTGAPKGILQRIW